MASLVSAGGGLEERHSVDPSYAPLKDQYLMFPMLEHDFENWNSLGSAIFLNNKAVITPEAKNRKGLIHTREPNPNYKHWYAALDFNIGRDKIKELNQAGEGMAIYYLRNFDSADPQINENFYGFIDNFDGIGIFVNTVQTSAEQQQRKTSKLVGVSSFINDGQRRVKEHKKHQTCYRELTGSHLAFSKIAIEYESPTLTVSVYDHGSQ